MNEGESLLEALRSCLKHRSTGRWHWDKIDYCWTGKDADLESWGQQGLELVKIEFGVVSAIIHCGKTVAGHDVTLNTPQTASEEEYDKAREFYVEQALEIVSGCGYPGDWSGDDWYLHEEFELQMQVIFSESGEGIDVEITAHALCEKAQHSEEIASWDKEIELMSNLLSQLAGWQNLNGHRCKEGRPGPGSAWRMRNK